MPIIILLIILIVLVLLLFVIQVKKPSFILDIEKILENREKNTKDEFQRNRQEIGAAMEANRKELSDSLFSFEKKLSQDSNMLKAGITQQFHNFGKEQSDQSNKSIKIIQYLTATINEQLKDIREDNSKQLREMRQTVDEKLQNTLDKRLGDSFKIVTEKLEAVHQGLGEMKNLATDVGGLKKVLSNVKTRGILGEHMLGNILENILSEQQYTTNVATKKGSQAHVEFAIKCPGQSLDEEIWIPIDSKFPLESYELLIEAYDSSDKDQVEVQKKILFKAIDTFAKDISSKYIDPPHTTDYGIMFLPMEGLYAEVVRNITLFENVLRKYNIIITGPTTMAATLYSFRMGFNTLVMNKKSNEVWKVLEGVKSEFANFGSVLEKVDSQLNTASKTLGNLKTTRVNVMDRKLRAVTEIPSIDGKNTSP